MTSSPDAEAAAHARRATELAEQAVQPGIRLRRARLLAAVAQVHATLAARSVGQPPAPPPRAAHRPVEDSPMPLVVPPAGRSTLFERLKGQDGISQVVQDFYTRVLGDPQLAHYFEGVAMWRLQRHMVAFLVQATGGPAAYDGRDMASAHAGLHITTRDFDRVARHLVETLVAFGIHGSDVDEMVSTIAPLKQHIVTVHPTAPPGMP